MSHFIHVRPPYLQRIFQFRPRERCSQQILRHSYGAITGILRCASHSAKPETPPPGPSSQSSKDQQQRIRSLQQKRQADASKKAARLLRRLSANGKKTGVNQKALPIEKTPLVENIPASKSKAESTNNVDPSPEETVNPPTNRQDQNFRMINISKREAKVQRQILRNQKKIFWPSIWTALALTGTLGTFAYLDTKYDGDNSVGSTHSSQRAQIPQTWYLTPTVIQEGIKAGWDELDKLTISILVVSIGIHLLKKSPLPFWEKLLHITGERKYTAFTYPFAHANWTHLGNNMLGLCWFLPGVVHYLDGDVIHAAAIFVSVPLITSYLNHWRCFLSPVSGIIITLGSSGSVLAIFGAFCAAYPNEKMWWPEFLVVRLDAQYWGALYVFRELYHLVKAPIMAERSSFIVHVLSFGLGAAYVYFDGKENLWKPIKMQLVKRDQVSDT